MTSKVEVIIRNTYPENAVYIKTPDNKHIAIDPGSWSNIDNLDFNFMSFENENRTEKEGLVFVRDIPIFDEYFRLNNFFYYPIEKNNPGVKCIKKSYDGMEILFFLFLHKLKNPENDWNMITLICHCDIKMLLHCNNVIWPVKELMDNSEFIKAIKDCDIFFAPHYNVNSVWDDELLKIINPRLTIISDKDDGIQSLKEKYEPYCRGWEVFSQGKIEQKKILSTEYDGVIMAQFGMEKGEKLLKIKVIQDTMIRSCKSRFNQ
jgi:hypothetical protein